MGWDLAVYGVSPGQGDTEVSIIVDLIWTNPGSANHIDLLFDKKADHDPPTTKELDDQNVETWDCGTLVVGTEYAFRIDVNHDGGTETGTVYYFTTAGGPPAPSLQTGTSKFHKNAPVWKYKAGGGVIKK